MVFCFSMMQSVIFIIMSVFRSIAIGSILMPMES